MTQGEIDKIERGDLPLDGYASRLAEAMQIPIGLLIEYWTAI